MLLSLEAALVERVCIYVHVNHMVSSYVCAFINTKQSADLRETSNGILTSLKLSIICLEYCNNSMHK